MIAARFPVFADPFSKTDTPFQSIEQTTLLGMLPRRTVSLEIVQCFALQVVQGLTPLASKCFMMKYLC